MKFKLLNGSHRSGKVRYEAGSIVESDFDLVKTFRNKFQKIEAPKPIPASVVEKPAPAVKKVVAPKPVVVIEKPVDEAISAPKTRTRTKKSA